jgi:hypothetical protein
VLSRCRFLNAFTVSEDTTLDIDGHKMIVASESPEVVAECFVDEACADDPMSSSPQGSCQHFCHLLSSMRHGGFNVARCGRRRA